MNIITIDGTENVSISTTEEARAARNRLLEVAQTVTRVTNPQQATHAANVLKDMKALTRSVELARTSVKAPILEQGKRIDALAKELTAEIEEQSRLIAATLGHYQAEQQRIADEARRKAWEEQQRIEAEAKAQIEALALKEARARSDAKKDEHAARAELVQEAAQQAIVEVRQQAIAKVAVKQEGIATRKVIKFEVENITALYEAAPYLVSLSPNTAAINQALKGLQKGQSLPGVKHWEEVSAIVR